MEGVAAEIAQISFYLAKPGTTFTTVLDTKKDALTQRGSQLHDFAVEDAKCRFIFFETVSNRANPPWLDFINENLAKEASINFSARNRSANGILLITIGTRLLAATFGRSATSYLEASSLEPDFGIKAAMNMCGNEEIRQTRSQSHAITPTQIDRQVGKPSDTFVFGLSEAEDLRYISAHMKGDSTVTLQGRDSLTVKVIGDNKLSWGTLLDRCKSFLDAYGKRDYETLFPNYKNFRQASDDEIEALDTELINALKKRELHRIQLGIPEFVSEEDFSFSYSNHSKKDNLIVSFLDIEQLGDRLDLDEVTIEKLKSKNIFAYSHSEDRVLPHRRWQLYRCISIEIEIDNQYFLLSDGRWLKIDDSFYQSIMKFTAEVLHEEPHEDAYSDIDISDDVQKKNLESIFNSTVCERRPSCILFDRAKLRIGEGPKNKEFCDILDLTDDGKMRIIHCKPYKDSSSTSYLFSQAQLYCEAFLTDRVFLTEIRSHIDASNNASKARYLDYIKDDLARTNGQDYTVCLWLLFNRIDVRPTKNAMPLMAQYELKLIHDRLRLALKFRDVILRFVPVRKTNYVSAKAPRRAVT